MYIFKRSTQSRWNHPHLTIHAPVKNLVAFPRAPLTTSIGPINSPPPSSESSFSDLHHRRRIGLIGLSTRPYAPTKASARIEPRTPCATITCWCHPCHVSIHITTTSSSTLALADVISLRHLADIIIGVDHWLLLGFKTLGTNVLELQCVLCWQTMIKT